MEEGLGQQHEAFAVSRGRWELPPRPGFSSRTLRHGKLMVSSTPGFLQQLSEAREKAEFSFSKQVGGTCVREHGPVFDRY